MNKSFTVFLLSILAIFAVSGCDKTDKNEYAFRAYNTIQGITATGTFHLYFNGGNITGNYNVKPDNYFEFSSGELGGNYTDSTFFINCPSGVQDFGNALIGSFEGNTIIGTVIYSNIVGSDSIGAFILKQK